MLSRLSVSAALLTAFMVAVVAPSVHAASPPAGMMRRIYAVMDLVAPIPNVTVPASTEPETTGKSNQTREGDLILLIQNTIKPESWAANGGSGTIDYFPLSGGLVINQSADIHEQVADLLGALRRLQEQEVALEVRVLTVADDDFERVGVDFNIVSNAGKGPKMVTVVPVPTCSTMVPLPTLPMMKPVFMNDRQVRQLLEGAAADPRTSIMQTPRITLMNGQSGCVCTEDGREATPEPKANGFHLRALPVVSADSRFVRVALDLQQTDVGNLHSTVTIPDGGTVVMGGLKKIRTVQQECGVPVLDRIPYVNRLFKNVGYGRETQRVYVLVTSRIVNAEESEKQLPQATTQAIPLCPATTQAVPMAMAATQAIMPVPVVLPPPSMVEVVPACPIVPASYYLNNPPVCTPCLPAGQASCQVPVQDRQAGVVTDLLKAYDAACAEGKSAEAKKYAKAALLIDPTCFRKK